MAGFFKELFSGIASAIEETADDVSVFFKRIRLGSKIKETQKNKVKLFCNLGELVYNLQMSGVINVKQCEGMCEEISEHDEKLRLLTEAEAEFAKQTQPNKSPAKSAIFVSVFKVDSVCCLFLFTKV